LGGLREDCIRGTIGGVFLFILVLLVASPAMGGGPANTSRISGFVMGNVNPAYNPFSALFVEDPQFTYRAYLIPYLNEIKDRQKLDRLYYPRTGEELIESYDVLVFYHARLGHFPPQKLHDLDTAFREEGMVGAASPSMTWAETWYPTILYDLLPVSNYYGYHENNPYRVVFRKELEPVFTPFAKLGMENVYGVNWHYMTPRQGSVTWADMQPNNSPWLVSWRPGGTDAGMMWIFTGTFDHSWWALSYGYKGDNPYVIDMVTNLLFHSFGMPLIEDIHARREARRVLYHFQAQKLLVLHMIEWADRFGANLIPLNDKLKELELEVGKARGLYVNQEYDATISFMESMSSEIIGITEEAVRLKNEAMAWVYVIEYLVVTSTSMVAGFAVWSLMVQRSRYRTVDTTRLRIINEDGP